jgi:hypothetical protein
MKLITFGLWTLIVGAMLLQPRPVKADDDDLNDSDLYRSAQLARLYELQAAFHRAASVHDLLNGDSQQVINQRLRDMLSLWADDAWALLSVGSPRDGYYRGKGEPDDPLTCPPPSDNAANRGTLCTLFKFVSGSFQPANRFVSLAPSYKTRFRLDGDGDTASVYFECHYFNVAPDPETGKPRVDGRGTLGTRRSREEA